MVFQEVFNAMEIVCPGVPVQVNGTRVQGASTSIRYGTCIVCSEHAFDSPCMILDLNMHVVRGTWTVEQVPISRHFYKL